MVVSGASEVPGTGVISGASEVPGTGVSVFSGVSVVSGTSVTGITDGLCVGTPAVALASGAQSVLLP